MGFTGVFEHSLDDRGRIALPSRYREVLVDLLVHFVKSPDGCVEVYPPAAFDRKAVQVEQAGDNDIAGRRLQRAFFNNSYEAEIDKQGRVLIPQAVRAWAGLNGTVTIAGRGVGFELWNPAVYAPESDISNSQYSENLRRLTNRETGS